MTSGASRSASDRSTPTRLALASAAAELRQRLDTQLGADVIPYASLAQGSEVHPWTARAEQLWTGAGGSDPWRQHHLAVLHHARAYDLEAARSDEAFHHWRQAVRHWARLHADDEFWRLMHDHLSEAMAVEVPAEVVDDVRARLPRDLLAPHVSLATRFRTTDPSRGREHVRLLLESGFPADVVDDAREAMVREVLDDVPQAVEEGRCAEMTAVLESWLGLDPTNPHLVQAYLHLHRRELERGWSEQDRRERLAASVARTERVARTVLSAADPPRGALAAEAARHEYFLGVAARDRGAAAADELGHFEAALRFDPAIERDGWYRDIRQYVSELRGRRR